MSLPGAESAPQAIDRTSMSKMSGELGMMPQAGKPPAPYCEVGHRGG